MDDSKAEEINTLRQKLREQVEAGQQPNEEDEAKLAELVQETQYAPELGDID